MSKPEDADEPFLSRWSRRKRDIAQGRVDEARVDDRAIQIGAEAVDAVGDAKVGREEPELDLSTLPKVEELTAESDFTVFLDKRVSAFLRNAALGKMWTLDPTIRDFIEVAENQWNWNVPGGAPFYEEILTLPGETLQAVAQAGSEAGSAILGSDAATAGHASAASASTAIRPKDDAQEVDPASEDNAPENETQTSEASTSIGATDKNIPASDGWRRTGEDVATQQSCAPQNDGRRRHGGALPA